MNDWKFRGDVFDKTPEDQQGFVYLITNTLDGRQYIGKKFFWFSGKKKVKGRKRKVRVEVESDWKTYHGSSGELSADVEKLGTEKFTREILHLCKTKAECSYMELKEQVERGVLLSDRYYNSWIRFRGTKKHLRSLVK